jgi:hypothetical protein
MILRAANVFSFGPMRQDEEELPRPVGARGEHRDGTQSAIMERALPRETRFSSAGCVSARQDFAREHMGAE